VPAERLFEELTINRHKAQPPILANLRHVRLARYAKRGGNFVLVVSGSLEADGTNQLIEIVYDLLIEAIQLGSLGCFEFGVSAVGLK
jgi:hypothetical protein